jgi:hypothetical protein
MEKHAGGVSAEQKKNWEELLNKAWVFWSQIGILRRKIWNVQGGIYELQKNFLNRHLPDFVSESDKWTS